MPISGKPEISTAPQDEALFLYFLTLRSANASSRVSKGALSEPHTQPPSQILHELPGDTA